MRSARQRRVELGEVEGAMSGLAIGVCGIITVLISMVVSCDIGDESGSEKTEKRYL